MKPKSRSSEPECARQAAATKERGAGARGCARAGAARGPWSRDGDGPLGQLPGVIRPQGGERGRRKIPTFWETAAPIDSPRP